jgi:hypothetical protein
MLLVFIGVITVLLAIFAVKRRQRRPKEPATICLDIPFLSNLAQHQQRVEELQSHSEVYPLRCLEQLRSSDDFGDRLLALFLLSNYFKVDLARAASKLTLVDIATKQSFSLALTDLEARLRMYEEFVPSSVPERLTKLLPNLLLALYQQSLLETVDLDKVASQLTLAPGGQACPAMAPSYIHFREILSTTQCTFAPIARIWGNTWQPGGSLESNVMQAIPIIDKFIPWVARLEHMDGFVFEIEDPSAGATEEALAKTARRVLSLIAENDPTGNCMKGDLSSPSWRYTFKGEPIFVTTFAPCYPATHPRYGFGSQSTFIYLQPEYSFKHHRIPSNSKQHSIRHHIRARFAARGQAYYSPDFLDRPMPDKADSPIAPLFVKPVRPMPLIDWRWWD